VRRRAFLAAAAVAVTVGVTGCGIPDESKVSDIGPGPEFGEARTGGAGAGPPARESATTKEMFVTNFLAAVAGEPNKRAERFLSYMTENARPDKVDADAGVNLVRLRKAPVFTELEQGSWRVTIDVVQVGVLDERGTVAPADLKRNSYDFEIAIQSSESGTDSYIVTKAPVDPLLMSTEALELYFTPRTLYFWSKDGATLLPDERYMPKELDEGLRPTRIVEWVVAGASAWLEPAVSQLSDKARNNQNVPYPKDQLEVALNAAAAEQTAGAEGNVVPKLGHQLLWSLRLYVKTGLRLSIDGGRSLIFLKDDEFYGANAANRVPEGPEQEDAQPERFALLDGKIHRLRESPGGGVQQLPRMLLSNGVNEGILQAALAREDGTEGLRTSAALVFQQNGEYKLRLVSAVGDGANPAAETEGFASMGRPVWLKASLDDGIGLVVANKRLYRFTMEGGMTPVDLPGVVGEITDVSAAADGRRIAVVAKGRVYTLTLIRDEDKVAVETARLVPTTVRDVSAVDWSEETKLVVAGTGLDDKPAVWEVSIDGAVEKSQFSDTGGKLQHLVAYPDDPVSASVSSTVMYSREGAAFDLAGDKPGIEASDVMGAEGEVDLSRVTAPFFLLD
jgi:hypothetical protein